MIFRTSRLCALLVLLLLTPAMRGQGFDLAVRYPAAIDWTENCPPVEWTCEASDVWSLSSFSYRLGDKFLVEAGPSTVVIGKGGTSAVFAAVFPAQPGAIVTAPSAAGERIANIWLRFNPARLGELFPASTVFGPGPESMLVRGQRLAAWKMDAAWMQDFLPSIPWMPSLTFDIDTPEGERRVYSVNSDAGDATYEPFFKGLTLPPEIPVEPAAAVLAYDTACAAIAATYPALPSGWTEIAARFRPQAERATTGFAAAQAIADAAAALRNTGLRVAVGKERPVQFTPPRPLRASLPRIRDTTIEEEAMGGGVYFLRRADGIGMILLTDASEGATVGAFDAALERHAQTWGLILDLRFCTSADETVARQLAGRFAEARVTYALGRERTGPLVTDLSEPLPRTLEPRGPWRYQSPVAVLTGRLNAGNAELLSLMLAAAGATTIGDHTGGVPAEVKTFEIGTPAMDIRLSIPARLDLTPGGANFWGEGIAPMVFVQDSAAYARPNPTDEAYLAAVRWLSETPEGAAAAGKALSPPGREWR